MQPCIPLPFVYHYLHSQSFPTWEQQKILKLDVHPRPSPEHRHEMMVKLRTLLHMNSMTHVLLDNLRVLYRMPPLPSRSGGISTTCLIPFKNSQDRSVNLGFTISQLVISQLQYNLSDQRRGPITKEHSPLVLPDKVKIVSAHSDGASHLRAVHGSGKNTSPDRYIASEWTLLINVGACMNSSDVVNKCIFVQMTPIPLSSCFLMTEKKYVN